MKNSKKGFTLVELLVVIAILAILATVAVVGYTSFTDKAHQSNDRSLVAQLNTATLNVEGKYETFHEVVEVLAEQGFDVTKIKATAKDHDILWNEDTQKFFYSADEALDGAKIWVVSAEVSEKYSTYYIGGSEITSNTATSICVATNGTNLTIKAPNADVYHYGEVANLTITEVKESSYHEFGRVTGLATISKGHLVVENGGSIGTLVVATTDVTLTGSVGVLVGSTEVVEQFQNNGYKGTTATATEETISGAVAFIGGVFYDDFATALAACTEGQTVVLLKDIAFAENKVFTIEAEQTVVIDLNGHVIAATAAEGKSSAVITNKGNLTIKDSVGGGKITTSALNPDANVSPSYASNVISNSGVLTLDGGILENVTSGAAATYCVDNAPGSTFTMNGGELVSAFDALRVFGGSSAITVTINGGTITGTGSPIWLQMPASAATVTLTITGGTVNDLGTDDWSAIHLASSGNHDYTNCVINISGCTVNGDIYLQAMLHTGDLKGNVKIENVTVSGEIIYDNDDDRKN